MARYYVKVDNDDSHLFGDFTCDCEDSAFCSAIRYVAGVAYKFSDFMYSLSSTRVVLLCDDGSFLTVVWTGIACDFLKLADKYSDWRND